MTPGMRHAAARPSWTCETCGRPWPCAAGWRELTTRYELTAPELRGFLSFALVNAIDDYRAHGIARPGAVGERILGLFAAAALEAQRSAWNAPTCQMRVVGYDAPLR